MGILKGSSVGRLRGNGGGFLPFLPVEDEDMTEENDRKADVKKNTRTVAMGVPQSSDKKAC